MPTALVAIENTVYSIDILYSYAIPDDLIAVCKKGVGARIFLGLRYSKSLTGSNGHSPTTVT